MNAWVPVGGLGEVASYFLRLGLLGFGGPVALVGQMERELVSDKQWLTKEQMREAIAVCQSLPGPLAIQVGIYISYLRAGFWGAWAGGWAFIFPNFVIVAALGALYVHLGDLPAVTAVFYGVSPAVIALILHSCYRLAKLGMEDRLQWALAAACLVVTAIVQAEVALLFIGAGVVGMLYYGTLFRRTPPAVVPAVAAPAALAVAAPLASAASASTVAKLLLFFLKAGALTFGSGLVIVPFLQQGLVQQYGWLDERQFLIAVADHRDVRRVSCGRFLGFARLDNRNFPAVLSACAYCGAGLGAASRQSQCARLHQGRLCSLDRNHPRRVYPPWPNCHRRLGNRSHRHRITRDSVPMEGEQSAAHSRDGSDWIDRISDAATYLGDGQIGTKRSWLGTTFRSARQTKVAIHSALGGTALDVFDSCGCVESYGGE
jgi:chromate transport protein ChrA